MKIYTGRGDYGKTSLLSGERVAKSNDRVEAYGDVDELNSVLGTLLSSLPDDDPRITVQVRGIQCQAGHPLPAYLIQTGELPPTATLHPSNSTDTSGSSRTAASSAHPSRSCHALPDTTRRQSTFRR